MADLLAHSRYKNDARAVSEVLTALHSMLTGQILR